MDELICQVCKTSGNFRSLHVPAHEYANYWICHQCGDKYEKDLEEFNKKYFDNKETPLTEGYYPPPWNPMENVEKTEGWIAFQQALRDDPKYYNEKETP